MTARLFPPLFRFVFPAICLSFFLNVSLVSAADALGPVFPEDAVADLQFDEPLPLPKRNPLLQRPKNKQVVFDDLDPTGSVIPQGLLSDEEEFEFQSVSVARQRRMPQTVETHNAIFTADREIIQERVQPMANFVYDETIGEYPIEMGGYITGPICQTFGMGLFDNLTLFAETTTFKTQLNNESGSWGIGEGINWSTPITPQGTITAQCGARAVQGDLASRSARSQCFITAGAFKRFDFAALQGGVAVDWLHDHSQFGSVDLRQMRCELSARSFLGLEYGFIGGFDVFRDRPTTPNIDRWAINNHLSVLGGTIDVQDYYLLFVRKQLASGGQVEFRCGSTERGDVIIGALGEAAITDRLAVNGGFTLLTPSEGQSVRGNQRENWSMSLGVVLYFRGGAMCQQANMYRPMFDVAGNNSFFTRMIGR